MAGGAVRRAHLPAACAVAPTAVARCDVTVLTDAFALEAAAVDTTGRHLVAGVFLAHFEVDVLRSRHDARHTHAIGRDAKE